MKPSRKTIEWDEVRHRLEAAWRRLDEKFAPPPEQVSLILEARARALAVEPAAPPGPGFEALEFLLAREHYLLATHWVREVFPLQEITPLPGTPGFVLGIIHLRGRIVSVLDIKQFFDLPRQGLSDLNKVIVLSDGAMEFGILGDAIVGVRRIALDDLQAPLPTLTDIRAEYLTGITRQREVVLDGKKLLSDPDIVVTADLAGGVPASDARRRRHL